MKYWKYPKHLKDAKKIKLEGLIYIYTSAIISLTNLTIKSLATKCLNKSPNIRHPLVNEKTESASSHLRNWWWLRRLDTQVYIRGRD